ncbi:helicase-exonuclease AddAB subunit AddA [Paenibacillus humicus]|uniref:helicase-exonuclease AddAB subunit AddA n=1 Tax=Paenibacillus humicus TaxID=412861 RepID=UPI003F180351
MAMEGCIPKPEGSTWTDDQWRAITARGEDVLVAAAAGSGKTAVLVERIIRIISEDTDVDRLLVATFTKAAAAEMKERIRTALEAALERDPSSEHLRRQLALLGRASITTLHSFCLDVIRRYYPLIGLDPGFRVANETEAELLRLEVLDELFEERYAGDAGGDGDFLRLADRYGGEKGDEPLYRLVQQLYDFSRSQPWPDDWLRAMAAAFSAGGPEELQGSPWVAALEADIALALGGARLALQEALRMALLPEGPSVYADTLREDLSLVAGLTEAVATRPWDEWRDAWQLAGGFGRLKSVRGGDADKSLQERVKDLRDEARSLVDELGKELFSRSAKQYAAELEQLAPLMRALAELVIEFDGRYQLAKRKKGLLDFGDLEHYCLQILRADDSRPGSNLPSAAALDYRKQFREVLLDEYQDTNRVQESIVELLTGVAGEGEGGTRFMVGDVKQSIYRFRLAEPDLFLEKYRLFRPARRTEALGEAEAAGTDAGAPGRRIDLARNFRSRLQVVDGVNAVFKALMRESVAEMEYDEAAELVLGATYPDPDPPRANRIEFALIDREGTGGRSVREAPAEQAEGSPEAEQREEAADLQTAQLEARYIAGRIRQLREEGFAVHDRKGKRGLAWRDIVILLRATKAWAPILMEELQAAGIPAYAELGSGYFDAVEVEVMLSALRVVDNPYQDIPLAGLLRSPMFGLNAEELAGIRIGGGKGYFYEAVVKAADDLLTEGGLRRKLSLFLGKLDEWRDAARQGSLADLIWRIYGETGYYDWAGGLAGGMQRQANLRSLHDRARQFEAGTARGLFRFLRFMDRMRENGGDLGTAGALGEGEDVVRIMSIHKSKGLEFPVVFVAGLGKKFNQQDMSAPFLMHKELGFGPKFIDPDLRLSYPTLPCLAIRRRMRMEMQAEELRVLYVALTRPKEKMILVGTTDDAAKTTERWASALDESGRLSDYRIASARRFLDWLGPLAGAGMMDIAAMPLAEAERTAPEDTERELRDRPDGESPPASEGAACGSTAREPHAGGLEPAAESAAADQPAASSDGAAEAAAPAGKPLQGRNGFEEWEAGVVPYYTLGSEAAAAADSGSAGPDPDELQAVLGMIPIAAGGWEAEVERRLSWEYPYGEASRIAAKTSVTEMKRMRGEAYRTEDSAAYEEGPFVDKNGLPAVPEALGSHGVSRSAQPRTEGSSFRLRRPQFMERKKLTAAEKGTVLHTVMQHLPLAGSINQAAVEDTVAELVRKRILTEEQASAADTASVVAFFEGSLGQRLLRSSKVRREVPFSSTLPAARVYPGTSASEAGEPVLIQGVVDCLFEEGERLILVDYKTDRLVGGASEAAEKHRFQLELYASAIEAALGRPVDELHIYFLDSREAVQLTPDEKE